MCLLASARTSRPSPASALGGPRASCGQSPPPSSSCPAVWKRHTGDMSTSSKSWRIPRPPGISTENPGQGGRGQAPLPSQVGQRGQSGGAGQGGLAQGVQWAHATLLASTSWALLGHLTSPRSGLAQTGRLGISAASSSSRT